MFHHRPFHGPRAAAVLSIVLLGVAMRAAVAADIDTDLRTLAQQRPWRCAAQLAGGPGGPEWLASPDQCAWRDLLRMRQWRSTPALAPAPTPCVSAAALGWAWARASSASAAAPAAWRSAWVSHSLIGQHGDERRIVIVQRLHENDWRLTEWRWNPSPRAATRRWQQQRWNALLERAAQLRAPDEPAQGTPETRLLRAVLEAHVDKRAAQVSANGWHWSSAGLCLHVDAAGLGQQIMQLPHAVDDSRQEQRAAMQLQLARRYPKARWLSEFALLPATPQARGAARFYALWVDGTHIKGQLWIPTKGNGPLERVRLTAALGAAALGPGGSPALAHAELVLRRELSGLAARWTAAHE